MKYKVGFLIDKKNSWIEKSIKKKFKKNNSKYLFLISRDKKTFNKFDILFILGFTKILSSKFLSKNNLNLIVHESDLPKGKGLAPVQWQILKNKNRIPITLFKANKEVDSGDIYLKDYFLIEKSDLDDEIRAKQSLSTIKIIKKFLKNYPKIQTRKQKGKSTYFKKRSPKDHKLNIKKSIKENFNLLRISNNYKYPAYFNLYGKKYILKIFKDE
jgi:methionyl-tRNA formyltransferase|tara:strand:+ start:229 stop:870 length:642 start_codon:yes stop_codon:yes gene_type:complete